MSVVISYLYLFCFCEHYPQRPRYEKCGKGKVEVFPICTKPKLSILFLLFILLKPKRSFGAVSQMYELLIKHCHRIFIANVGLSLFYFKIFEPVVVKFNPYLNVFWTIKFSKRYCDFVGPDLNGVSIGKNWVIIVFAVNSWLKKHAISEITIRET